MSRFVYAIRGAALASCAAILAWTFANWQLPPPIWQWEPSARAALLYIAVNGAIFGILLRKAA